ncbi:MAG: lectin-like protein, partial [Phycisphaerales bacterium]|nr:lectin-like protein [Phycisphaerales bacterium]
MSRYGAILHLFTLATIEGPRDPKEREEMTRLMMTVMAMACGGPAVAQEAVQWRVEDGGNGHWYAHIEDSSTWEAARDNAASQGGYLATPLSAAENEFVLTDLLEGVPYYGPWFGLYQDFEHPDYSEPDGGWVWVTGEALEWTNWESGEPNDSQGEHWGSFLSSGEWNDYRGDSPGHIIEWSADCNGDGIVDYGQILDGTYADDDGNGVPDCCDAGDSCDAVQWRVEDGGN